MKNRRGSLTGTKEVYGFTLRQMTKGPANLIMLLILILTAAAVPPVMALVNRETKTEKSEITAVYIQNETGYTLSADEISEEPYFADTVFTDTDLTEETYGEALGDTEVFVHLWRKEQNGSFEISVFTLENTIIGQQDLSECVDQLNRLLDYARYQSMEADESQMELLMSGYWTEVQNVKEYLEPQEDDFNGRFSVQLVYSIVVMMLCTFASSFIVQKVIEEKASKLTEMLMVSVKPLALLVGKILAVMTCIFGELLIFAAVFAGSAVMTQNQANVKVTEKLFAAMQMNTDTLHISVGTAAILAVSVLLGYLTVSFLAGLLGAACSSMEEVESVNMVVVVTVMAGYFAAVVTMAFDDAAVAAAVSLIPVASIFCAPARYIIGDIGFGLLILSWAIQILTLVLLALGCARVYRDLMLYRGNRMKLGKMLSMIRQGGAR